MMGKVSSKMHPIDGNGNRRPSYLSVLLVVMLVQAIETYNKCHCTAQELGSASEDMISSKLGKTNRTSQDQRLRSKRQASLPQPPTISSGLGGTEDALHSGTDGSSSTNGSINSGDSFNSDQERAHEELLTGLKCDFGSAEAPDLCKFKLLYFNELNPLNKGQVAWTLGNGRLAFFQGGPLIDGSQGNDTSGSYIFYETSNPYAVGAFPANEQSNSSLASTLPHETPPTVYQDYMATATHKRHHQNTANSNRPAQDYGYQQQHSQVDFQQFSSGRVSVGSHPLGPTLLSPNLTAPGPVGMCLSFQYAIQGLSAEELRIYVNDHKTGRSRQIWTSSESADSNWTKGEVLYSVTNQHALMFSATSGPLASIKDPQQRKFRGHLALDEIEINKHDQMNADGACKGHCNFDGDMCGWTNAESGQEDNFDWTFGRGSDNLFTGPARDFTSSMNNEPTGSYIFTDSGFPRRPGDRALLISPMFQPTAVNDAMCMRFAVHMFGSGVGSLAIKIRYADDATQPGGGIPPSSGQSMAGAGYQDSVVNGQGAATSSLPQSSRSPSGTGIDKESDLIIWEMAGDAGNSWHQAQTSVSSSRSPFQVLIEGVIGENHLGNIAIDDISFSTGPCPTSPPIASKNYGDCTFEQSMCYWRNPEADIHLDDLDWIRTANEQGIHGPNFDHTLKRRSGSYLKLENTFREPKSGTRAFLLSPVFQPKASASVQCLSFYYYMFMRSIGSSGPNLGTIRVYLASNNELVPIWRLTNPISSPNWKHGRVSLSSVQIDAEPQAPTKLFQIAFEGIWGDAATGTIALDDITVFDGACDIRPPEAKSVHGECTFDVDMCSWNNRTYEDASNSQAKGLLDPSDTSQSPFLQSVTNGPNASGSSLGASHGTIQRLSNSKKQMSWQLATVESRPVNLQDHTYKAPIGYAYVDVLDGSSQPMSFQLQGAEVNVPAGQQLIVCITFWFAAYGRDDLNQLQVYSTQASASLQPIDEAASPEVAAPSSQTGMSGEPAAISSRFANSQSTPKVNQLAGGPSGGDGENSGSWKNINGKLLWSIGLRNITESNRRKWIYGQVSLRADSNYIVRFIAHSKDGGFALDDLSFSEGGCEARPVMARVQSAEDEMADLQAAQAPTPTAVPKKPAQ